MQELQASERCRKLRSPIRDLVSVGKKLEKNGKKVYWFNIGDPNKFDFDTPKNLKNAMKCVMDEKSGYYSDSLGDDKLREAIAEKEKKINNVSINKNDVIVTNGISEGIHTLMNSIITPGNGDEILIPGPAYPVYPEIIKFSGGVPVEYKLDEDNEWQIDTGDLRNKITSKTRAIVIINPNNPTGSVLNKETIKEVIDTAGEFNLPLISDEIYDRLVFGETKFYSTASLAEDVPIIGFNGFSKVYLVPGWRVGYMYFYDMNGMLESIKEGVAAQLRQRLSACTPVMKACTKAFDDDSHIQELVKKLRERAEFAYKKLNDIEGISTTKPKGAFYIFPKVNLEERWKNDEEFSYDVLKSIGLAIPYGSGFSPIHGKSHFRSVILPPVEIMDEAFSLLKDFMEKRI